MAGLDPAIHGERAGRASQGLDRGALKAVGLGALRPQEMLATAWMAGSSPAMTEMRL